MADEDPKPDQPDPSAKDGPKPEPSAKDDKPEAKPEVKPELGDAGKRALSAEREARKSAEKRAKEFEDRLAAIEEKDKTEAQKLADKLAKAETRAKSSEARALRYEVAAEKNVPADLIEFLVGDDREELEAKADKLAGLAVKEDPEDSPEKPEPTRRPKERLKPGAAPDAEPVEMNPEKLAASIPRRW